MSGETSGLTQADIDAAIAEAVLPLTARIDAQSDKCAMLEGNCSKLKSDLAMANAEIHNLKTARERLNHRLDALMAPPPEGSVSRIDPAWIGDGAAASGNHCPKCGLRKEEALGRNCQHEDCPLGRFGRGAGGDEAIELELPLPECAMHEKLLVALKTEFIVCAGARNASDNLHLILQPKHKAGQ